MLPAAHEVPSRHGLMVPSGVHPTPHRHIVRPPSSLRICATIQDHRPLSRSQNADSPEGSATDRSLLGIKPPRKSTSLVQQTRLFGSTAISARD
jgi:hypothetical protein